MIVGWGRGVGSGLTVNIRENGIGKQVPLHREKCTSHPNYEEDQPCKVVELGHQDSKWAQKKKKKIHLVLKLQQHHLVWSWFYPQKLTGIKTHTKTITEER